MKRVFQWRRRLVLPILFLLMVTLLVQYLWTGTPPLDENLPTPTILAHRGVHLNYQKGVYDAQTGCEAKHIFSPTHGYIENTLLSIHAAFDAGADIVEIDIRKTVDSNLVIFHDYDLECRTNGKGRVSQHTTHTLQQLDIGYGYTDDNGKTFPFRGKGTGLMPTLSEVLAHFPKQQFLIDHKDWDSPSRTYLTHILEDFPKAQRDRLWFWSSPFHQQELSQTYPEIKPLFFTRKEAKHVFGRFFFSFGLIKPKPEHHGKVMAIPAKYIPYLWGWPYRFIKEVHDAHMKLYLMIDSEDEALTYRSIPVDGFVTDYIEVIGPIIKPSDK